MHVARSLALVLALTAAACGNTSPTPAADASATDLGANADASAVDAAGDAGNCDPGAPPVAEAALPAIHGTMAIVGGDAGVTAPTPSGGDMTGSWVIETVDMYWPQAATGQIVPAGGSVTGTGWGVFQDGRYRIETDLVLRVDSTAAGIVARPSSLVSRGTYVAMGTDLVFTPDCSASAGTAPSLSRLGVSRDAADRGRLFATVSGGGVRAQLVLGVRRVP